MTTTAQFTMSWDNEPLLGPNAPGSKRMSSGPLVQEWRAYLVGRGANVSSAGDWDSTLTNATRAFQDEVGIKADGLVGGDTRNAAKSRGFRVGGVVPSAVANSGWLTPASLSIDPVEPPPAAPKKAGTPNVAPGEPMPDPSTKAIPVLDVALWPGAPVTRGQALGGAALLTGLIFIGKGLLGARPVGQAALLPDYSGGCGCGG